MWLTLAPTNMVKGSLIPRIPEPWLLLELVHFRKWIWSSQQDILNWLVCKLSSSDLKILRTRARLDNYLSIVIKITLNRQFKFCLHMYHLNVSSHGQVSVWYSSYHGAHVSFDFCSTLTTFINSKGNRITSYVHLNITFVWTSINFQA